MRSTLADRDEQPPGEQTAAADLLVQAMPQPTVAAVGLHPTAPSMPVIAAAVPPPFRPRAGPSLWRRIAALLHPIVALPIWDLVAASSHALHQTPTSASTTSISAGSLTAANPPCQWPGNA
jgi:hypothetical protein